MPSAKTPDHGSRPRVALLPTEIDSFVGRRRELAEIRRLFSASQLVTLVGLGGVGKSRLALRASAQLSRGFADGVWFAELGDLQDRALLVPAVAEKTGLREQSNTVTLTSLVDHLAPRRALLVLDNCEHLLDDVARLADTLLRSCPDLRLLGTSREPLGIAGEALLRLQPLTVPASELDPSPQALPRFESVSLLTERASVSVPEFRLTEHNSRDVARICRQLDGVPLAIELAAARLRTLTARELADRLADRYSVLTGGSRVAPLRHQTLRLCVDWSYDQCSPPERLLWSRLSVFVGGFELEAVEGTCAFGALQRDEILDVLSSLVDKSIVSRDSSEETATHFRLLETLREYGLERLHDSGDFQEMRRRHRDWYATMVDQVREDLVSPRQLAWTTRLDRELPNVRAALEHSIAHSDEMILALRMAGILNVYWISRGLLSEGRYWLGRALSTGERNACYERAQALFTSVALAGMQGDTAAAQKSVDECLQVAAVLKDRAVDAYADSVRGMLALFTGDLPTAVEYLDLASQGHHATGDTLREVEILIGLALASGLLGDTERAKACHKRILAITEPRGESWYRAYSLWALGIALWREDEHAHAASMLLESLALRRRMSDLMGSAWCVEGLSLVAAAQQQHERAAVLLGASSALSEEAGTPAATFPDLVDAYSNCMSQIRRVMGDRAFDRAYDRGRRMGVDDAVAYALGDTEPDGQTSAATEGPDLSALTPREREVAALVASGLTNKEIASKLVISPRTAENHVEKVLVKLGLTSRTQIATWVAEQH